MTRTKSGVAPTVDVPRAPGSSTVSILITHYNQAEVLPAAIESALHQTWPCEVVLVDDGSDDAHRPALRGWPVKLLELPHMGYAGAVAKGLEAATGTYIVLLNGDDVLHPRFVERLLQALASNPGARFAYAGAYLFGPHTGVPWRGLRMHVRPFRLDQLFRGNYLNATALVEASVWREMKGFDPVLAMYEDWDFWLRVAQAGISGVAVDEPLFYYRHAKKQSRNRAARSRREEIFRRIQSKSTGNRRPEGLRRALKLGILGATSALSFVLPQASRRLARALLDRSAFAGPVFVPVPRKEATPDFAWIAAPDCQNRQA